MGLVESSTRSSYRSWSVEEVANAVASLGTAYSDYGEALKANGVDGGILETLTERDFDELNLNIKNIHRQRMLRELNLLRTSAGKCEGESQQGHAVSGGGVTEEAGPCSEPDPLLDGKFSVDLAHFVFGDGGQLVSELMGQMGHLTRSVEQECTANDNGMWVAAYRYVVEEACVELALSPTRVRDRGRSGARLKDFCNHSIAQQVGLTESEVACIRLYTGPLHKPWNATLRNCGNDLMALTKWATCIAVLSSAVAKLATLCQPNTLYCAVDDRVRPLPATLCGGPVEGSGRDGMVVGTELGFMSATADKNCALFVGSSGSGSSGSGSSGSGSSGCVSGVRNYFRILCDKASGGCAVRWVSQFPDDAEWLLPPCTLLTWDCDETCSSPEEGVRWLTVRATTRAAVFDVGGVTSCMSVPDHDERHQHQFLHNSSLAWRSGMSAFSSSQTGGCSEFRIVLEGTSETELACIQAGDFLMTKNLPVSFDGAFNPNAIWYECTGVDRREIRLQNIGVRYNATTAGTEPHDWTSVRYLHMAREKMPAQDVSIAQRLFLKRAAKNLAVYSQQLQSDEVGVTGAPTAGGKPTATVSQQVQRESKASGTSETCVLC
jgi:hypothetical protein